MQSKIAMLVGKSKYLSDGLYSGAVKNFIATNGLIALQHVSTLEPVDRDQSLNLASIQNFNYESR